MKGRQEINLFDFYQYIINDKLDECIKYCTIKNNDGIVVYSANCYPDFPNNNIYRKNIFYDNGDKYLLPDKDVLKEYLLKNELLNELKILLRIEKILKLRYEK